MSLRSFPLVSALLLACAASPPAPATNPEPAAPSASEPSAPVADEPTAEDPSTEAAADTATELPAWRPPLPPLVLAELDEAQKAEATRCADAHRIQAADVTPRELLAAARCFGEIPVPGHEIRIYKHLQTHHPDAPESMEAARDIGLRFEQVDLLPQAIDAYEHYLQVFPKQADARGLGQRAVCLARAVGLEAREQELLASLERFYGRRGFTRPSAEALVELCGETSGGPRPPPA